jgi:hypothetical protein
MMEAGAGRVNRSYDRQGFLDEFFLDPADQAEIEAGLERSLRTEARVAVDEHVKCSITADAGTRGTS